MPGQPGPSTTVISPAGESTASSCTMAWRAASRAKYSGDLSRQEEIQRDPAAAARVAVLRNALRPRAPAPTTFSRAMGWRSKLRRPSLVATSTSRRLSA